MRLAKALIVSMLVIALANCWQNKGGASETSAAKPPMQHPANQLPPNGATTGPIATDFSGHGAVLCNWGIYVAFAAYMDTCFPGEDPGLREELANGIEEINAFIVANSQRTVSKADLEARIAKESAFFRTLPRSQVEAICSASPNDQERGLFAGLRKSLTREKLRASIADLLSVPRPPVINPCL